MPPYATRQPHANHNMAEGSVISSSTGSSSSSKGNNKAPGTTPMVLVPAPAAKKTKHQSPQASIDEFWSKFNSKTPGRGGPTSLYPSERGHLLILRSCSYDYSAERPICKASRGECSQGDRRWGESGFILRRSSKYLQREGGQNCQGMPTS
jgi:hypothetical protein